LAINRDALCTDNVGGSSDIYIFEYVKYARSLIKVTDNILVTFPYSVVHDLNALQIGFSEKVDEEDGGVTYSQSGNFDLIRVLPTDSYKDFAAKDWRIIIKDNNGNYRLIGLDTGVKLKFSKENGTNLSDFNGFKFTFETKEENTAPFMSNLTGFFINEYPNLGDENGNEIIDNNNNNIQAKI
tara:strand:+ start:782 stop:1330 length:549 start_codon:yes stop_codon:yes gene_type:complete